MNPMKFLPAMGVSCTGANAPGIMLVNVLMVFGLIVVFDSGMSESRPSRPGLSLKDLTCALVFCSDVFLYTTMPALFQGSAVGTLLLSGIEPGFRTFVQLFLAQINVFGFVPVYHNDEVTEDPQGENALGVEQTQFRNGLCDRLSEGGLADSALASLSSIVAWSIIFPILHLLLHTVSIRVSRCCLL